MVDKQDKIIIDKEKAERMAYDFIRDRIGNVPHITQATLEDEKWIVPIDVNYPKVFLNKENNPVKTRFIKIPNVSNIVISAKDGKFVSYPTVWTVEAQINRGMEIIKNSVEKALVKVGAENFSILPFSEHRYTPILDILATLLTEEKLSLSEATKDEEQASKYAGYVKDLEKIGLVRVNGDIVIPGNLFTTMEEILEGREGEIKSYDRLSVLLTLFFERGYNYISSVRSVLGSHLALGGFIYQESFEYGDSISFTKDDVRIMIDNEYKNIKIPRYFLQLERIGLLEEDKTSGTIAWKPKEEVFDKFCKEKDILEPISQMISNSH